MRKKPSSLALLLLLVVSVFSALNVGITSVSASGSSAIYIDPTNSTGAINDNFTISIKTDYNGSDVFGYSFTLTYNPIVLEGVDVVNGSLISGIYATLWQAGEFDNENGTLSLTENGLYDPMNNLPKVTSGPGTLANVTFKVAGTGDSDITLGTETRLIGYNTSTGEKYNIIDVGKGQIQHGYFSNKPDLEHNVAVTNVTASPTDVYASQLVSISVTVKNLGNVSERFDVTVYYSNVPIETKTVTNLAPNTPTTVPFTWNTTNAAGNHTISAEASDVGSTQVPETSLADNALADGKVLVKGIRISVTPDEIIDTAMGIGTSFDVNITITDAYNLTKAVFNLTWNPDILSLTGIVNGGFLDPGVFTTINGTFIKEPEGVTVAFTSVNYTRTAGLSTGNGILAIATFEVVDKGGSYISIEPSPTWYEDWWRTIPKVTGGIFANKFDITVDEIGITNVPLLELIHNSPSNLWTPGMESYGIIDVYPSWGILFPVTVTTINNGFLVAEFNVTLSRNGTLFATCPLPTTVLGGFTKRVMLTWNVTGEVLGLYNLTGVLTTLTNETNTADNEMTVWMKVKMTGDIDGDADVDGEDYWLFSGSYGVEKFEIGYSLDPDLDADGDVDGEDYWRFSGNYGLNTTAYGPGYP